MCTIKFSIELNTYNIDDKDLNTNNICEKSETILKMDDTLVCHLPGSVNITIRNYYKNINQLTTANS